MHPSSHKSEANVTAGISKGITILFLHTVGYSTLVRTDALYRSYLQIFGCQKYEVRSVACAPISTSVELYKSRTFLKVHKRGSYHELDGEVLLFVLIWVDRRIGQEWRLCSCDTTHQQLQYGVIVVVRRISASALARFEKNMPQSVLSAEQELMLMVSAQP
ncbi:hypothetical protein BDW74DRAFT_107236 [Aspergillus multicolor]|uniref:uncharacterized protein n=1 Tax=Aspergillus multicolor TaxID=41759 RepID=UPI003CCE4DD6